MDNKYKIKKPTDFSNEYKYIAVDPNRVCFALVEYDHTWRVADLQHHKDKLVVQACMPKAAKDRWLILLGSRLDSNCKISELFSRPLKPSDFNNTDHEITNQILINAPNQAYSVIVTVPGLTKLLGADTILCTPQVKPVFEDVKQYNAIGVDPHPNQSPWLADVVLKIPKAMIYSDWEKLCQEMCRIDIYMSFLRKKWELL
jgi:hypothetical protein